MLCDSKRCSPGVVVLLEESVNRAGPQKKTVASPEIERDVALSLASTMVGRGPAENGVNLVLLLKRRPDVRTIGVGTLEGVRKYY